MSPTRSERNPGKGGDVILEMKKKKMHLSVNCVGEEKKIPLNPSFDTKEACLFRGLGEVSFVMSRFTKRKKKTPPIFDHRLERAVS